MTIRRRLIIWVALGMALVLGAAAYVEFHWALRIGAGPAGPPVPAEPFAKPWSERPVLVLGIGDSVTAGFGARHGYSYFDRLVQNPADEFPDMRGKSLAALFPNLEARNISLSGSTSLDHVARIEAQLTTQPADLFGIVVMTTGGNDLIHWYGRTPPREGAMYGATLAQAQPWIASFEQRLDTMFDRIVAAFPGGCLILVADIYDPSDGSGDPESAWLPAWPDVLAIHAAYNETLRRVAARHRQVRVVPMHETFLGHGIHCRQFWHRHYVSADPHYWYAPNIEDPNERGYDAIRRVFLKRLLQEQETWSQLDLRSAAKDSP